MLVYRVECVGRNDWSYEISWNYVVNVKVREKGS